jgi:hypothetical protein
MAEAALSELTEVFSSEAANACLDELLGELDDDTVEITEAELGELSFTPPAGVDEASAWQVVFTIEGKLGTAAAGVSVDAYIDLIQLRNGDTTAEVNTLPEPVRPRSAGRAGRRPLPAAWLIRGTGSVLRLSSCLQDLDRIGTQRRR